VLDEAPDVIEQPQAVALPHARGEITFRDVGFAYPGGAPVLHSISFDVAAGTRVGIAGPTGAGKTTLISLIMRFYDPSSGRILLDGRDVRDYRLADLRNQFAIVPQEPVLFSTSVAENIGYARPGASYDQIMRAARAADAHDFIIRLPDGYDTLVGERGMMLSGGERQRVALARAFLKDAPVLVLDEPTSSVDPATERGILSSMQELMRGRTSFMIAHRASTLEDVDVLFRVESGRITVRPLERLAPGGVAIGDSAGRAANAAAVGGAARSALLGIEPR
jgi:ATP-binding cassette subfamily B protein